MTGSQRSVIMNDVARPGESWTDQLGSRVDDLMRRGFRKMHARGVQRPVDEPPAVVAQAAGSGRWAGLAQAAVACALTQSGVSGTETLGLIRALYGIEDEQARMLRSIERTVRLLQDGPFRSGRLLLSEAARLGPADPEYQRMLAAARGKFYDAQPLAASVQGRAVVEMHLGLVWLTMGRAADALHWLQQSYQSARIVLDVLARQSADVKVLHSRWSTAALTVYYPVGLFVVPAKLKKVWSAERALTAIDAFLPFVNCIAETLNVLDERDFAPTLELTGSPAAGFTLREISA